MKDNDILESIQIIRGEKVMLDSDLARMYGVETKALNQAVKRNIERFPSDFMFMLTRKEFLSLRSQFVTSSLYSYGGKRYLPLAFTEQGVAMLSSVLRSKKAIKVNILIMRAFVNVRKLLASNEDLSKRISELESEMKFKFFEYDKKLSSIFKTINKMLIEEDSLPSQKIGFDVTT